MLCPVHTKEMVANQTEYGIFFSCPHLGCSIGKWDKSTATPANWSTRNARRKAHEVFDALWRGRTRITRPQAYQWLAKVMGLPADEAHIGKFTKAQCDRLIRCVDILMEEVVDKARRKKLEALHGYQRPGTDSETTPGAVPIFRGEVASLGGDVGQE